MKTLIKQVLLCSILSSLATLGSVYAKEDVKHKTIEIKAEKGQDVNVWVQNDDIEHSVVVTAEELADSELLAAKLADLDPETRKTVLKALQGLNKGEHNGQVEVEKVFVLNKGEGHRVEFMGEEDHDLDIEVIKGDGKKVIRKHIIHADGKEMALEGHSDVITKLIKKGKFSQAELDKIQAALDAKR
ncbi:hypothetical protein [Paraglaciecola aestuariivivens]